MSETRQRILDTARRLFNREGLSQVGVREVARAARLSPGNLSYHFPTKDALVAALVTELHELNARTVLGPSLEAPGLVSLYRAAVGSLQNMLPYRFVLLSLHDALSSSAQLREVESSLEANRRAQLYALIEALIRGGWLDGRRLRPRLAIVYEQGELISSGWLLHGTLRHRDESDRALVLRYAKLGMALLEPYCTPKGARVLKAILAGAHDG